MSLAVTLLVLGACVGLGVFAAWRDNQPVKSLDPRLIPWRVILIISFTGAILMLVHLVNLAGFETVATRPSLP
jgi:RsiW-degrading membrane proteinase PrsW (M82 family)